MTHSTSAATKVLGIMEQIYHTHDFMYAITTPLCLAWVSRDALSIVAAKP